MRVLSLSIFIGFFIAVPLYVLNSFVMPDLQSLARSYSHADATAERIAGQTTYQQ